MGKASKEKGKRGEREVAAIAREYGFEARRTAQYCGKTDESADVIGIPFIHAEVKRTERLDRKAARAQAERDAHGKLPCVITRANGEPWYAEIRYTALLTLIRFAIKGGLKDEDIFSGAADSSVGSERL